MREDTQLQRKEEDDKMDVIILGVYNKSDKENISKLISSINELKLVWNFENYNIEAEKGIHAMKKYYDLFDIGIIIDKRGTDVFSSYSLIYEISDYYLYKEVYPQFFNILEELKKIQFDKMIIAFANEWEENTPIKIEKINIKDVENRVNSIFVWCDSYRDLTTNTDIRDDFHPLILEVVQQITPCK